MEPRLTTPDQQSDERLATLSRRSDSSDDGTGLDDGLVPIVRLALRQGEGLPPVVRWVRQTFEALSGGRPVPHEQYASAIAQMLARKLRHRLPAASAVG